MQHGADLQRAYRRLAAAIMVAVIAALAFVSSSSQQAFQRELVPATARKAVTVGASLRALIFKAYDFGIRLDTLYGVEQAFREILAANPEFAYVAAADTQGQLLFQIGAMPPGMQAYARRPDVLALSAQGAAGREAVRVGPLFMVSVPLVRGDTGLGTLHIGIDSAFVDRVLVEMLLDVLVVLVVSLFFTLELLHFMAGARLEVGIATLGRMTERVRSGDFRQSVDDAARDEIGRIARKLDAAVTELNRRYQALSLALEKRMRVDGPDSHSGVRAAREAWEKLGAQFRFGGGDRSRVETESAGLIRIRAPLFAFILAEELTRPFLPAYVSQLMVPVPWLSPQVVIGLPIMLFMLIVAIGQPYLGNWSDRVGRRKAMLTGAAVAAIGFATTAFAHNLYDLLLWRSLCALGYAMVFVAAQGYVLDHTGPDRRAQGFALFIGAIMMATVCGPSIGGILADNIGIRPAFLVSALVACGSILAIRPLADGSRDSASHPVRAPGLREILALATNARFMTLTGLAAMPAKILLTGVCFYLVPLYIVAMGSTQAMAGRMLMVYAVMMVLIVPLAARVSDRSARRESLVAAGLVVSGLGGILLVAHESFLVVFGVVLSLGIGQALSIAAQSALVGEHCREEIAKYGSDAVYGVYRLLERLGNAIGPLAASVLVVLYGYPAAFVALCAFVVACGFLFALATRHRAAGASATALT